MNVSTSLGRPTLALLGLGLLGLAGCQPNIDNSPTPVAGNANFTRYLAVGNSLTAGFEDGGLYREGQLNSYPLIVSQQMAKAGGGQFRQPLFTEAQANGSGYLRLAAVTPAGPVTQNVTNNLAVRTTTPQVLYTKYLDPIENLGVPGIRMADIQTAGYGSPQGNPYFERITPDSNPFQSYFQRVKVETGYPAYGTTPAVVSPNGNVTFFSMWLGNNDVLGYATTGGAGQLSTAYTLGAITIPANTNLANPPSGTITRTDSFNTKATRMVALLTANGARGVISNIPDVTGIPFFTTVGPTIKARLTAGGAAGLVILTGGNIGNAASGNRKQIATTDIRDASGGRQLFTLPSAPYLTQIGLPTGRPWRAVYNQSGIGNSIPGLTLGVYLTVFGIDTTQAFGASAANPIPSAFVLDDVEQGLVSTATTAYNTSLQSIATARSLAFFDANTYFRQVAAAGVATNAVNNSAGYITGNLFSLDGVHPTPRGYALVANEIIKAINARYGGTVPQVDANQYRGILLP